VSRTDYNKDGRTDSYISNLQSQNTTTSIFDGRDGSLLKTLALPASEAQPPRPMNNGSSLGWSSRAPGDLNGDGEPDYVAAAPYQDVGANQDQGKVFFFLSKVPSSRGYYQVPGGGGGSGGKARTRLSASIRGIRRGGAVSSLARGRVIRAAGASAGCSGRVRVRVRRSKGGKLVASRLAVVGRTCRWSKRFVFPVRRLTRAQRRALARGKRVRLYASFRYGGNAGLLPSTASRRYSVKSRRGKK
jgi:FG-GAP-like repeat